MKRSLSILLLTLLGLIVCCGGEEAPRTSGNARVDAACEARCTACLIPDQTAAQCRDACIADVGTPTDACGAAIEALGTCRSQASCDACSAELNARDAACGGTG